MDTLLDEAKTIFMGKQMENRFITEDVYMHYGDVNFIEFKGKLINPSRKMNFEIGDECSSLYLLSNGIKPWIQKENGEFYIPKPTDPNATTYIRTNVNKTKNHAMISSIAQHNFCQLENLDEMFLHVEHNWFSRVWENIYYRRFYQIYRL